MAGRRTKLSDDVITEAAKLIATGNTQTTACAYLGITMQTWINWMKKGEDGVSPYVEFFDAIKKAEAKAKVLCVGRIISAAQQSWQAAAWWLERRYPEEFGRRDNAPPKDDGGLEKVADAIRDLAGAAVKKDEP